MTGKPGDGGEQSEHDTSKGKTTRRKVLKTATGAGITGVLASLGIGALSHPALAVSFTANSITIKTDSGQVTDVSVQPQNLDYSWNGLDSDPSDMTFTIYVDDPNQNGSSNTGTAVSNMSVLGSESDGDISSSSSDGYSGSNSYTFTSQYSLITDGPWSQSDFNNGNDGTTTTVQSAIEVVVKATLTTESGNTYTDTRRDHFDVDVKNESASVTGSGGSANTSGTGL